MLFDGACYDYYDDAADNDEAKAVQDAIQRYDSFLENKKGSDNYTDRGS